MVHEESFLNENETGVQVVEQKQFRSWCFSSCSSRHKTNEDSCAVYEWSGGMIAAVADGMGGHVDGDKASKTAVSNIGKILKAVSGLDDDSMLESIVIRAIDETQKDIEKKYPGAGSTLVVALVQNDRVRFYNIGDSFGAIFSKNGEVKYRTIEHSPIGFASESGLIEDQVDDEIHASESHYVLNALGSSPLRIEVSQWCKFLKTDRVLLASDGLLANVSESRVGELLSASSGQKSFTELVQQAQDIMSSPEGHDDDLTVVLVKRKKSR